MRPCKQSAPAFLLSSPPFFALLVGHTYGDSRGGDVRCGVRAVAGRALPYRLMYELRAALQQHLPEGREREIGEEFASECFWPSAVCSAVAALEARIRHTVPPPKIISLVNEPSPQFTLRGPSSSQIPFPLIPRERNWVQVQDFTRIRKDQFNSLKIRRQNFSRFKLPSPSNV
jgi:hypothetical protein